MRKFTVRVDWDHEAGVWYVTDSDVPGLVTEAETFEGLIDKISALVPELIELNAHHLDRPAHGKVPVEIIAHREMLTSA